MKPLDWVVMFCWLVSIVVYGLWRGRRSGTVKEYLLAGRSMPWYAMGLSIMATQASAITFISTTGQAYVDGMRFVQFYLGLPIAMVILSATAVKIFHRANVYTAYEYLEKRFDTKTRTLVSMVFLIQRGLGAGIALYAPAVVLSVILGWSDQWTAVLMGTLVVLYTTTGGIKAVTWADVYQMMVITGALFFALLVAISLFPNHVSFVDGIHLAGAFGRANAITWNFDWNDRYNVWSGLIGGSFLFLAYFGCDQSQVQRYLTGKSIAESRISLLFNAVAKIPMQFFILFIGAMVFVLFIFERPPIIFHPIEAKRVVDDPKFSTVRQQYDRAFEARRATAESVLQQMHRGEQVDLAKVREAQRQFDNARKAGAALVEERNGTKGFNDTNYIFLNFVTSYLPTGIVGLVIAVIFSAAMSAASGEINSLATVSMVDVYRRHFVREASDRHYLWASRIATAFWGCFAIVFSGLGRNLGALIEAVNLIGSLFYGGLLGVFVLAFFFRNVGANGAFFGVIAGEIAIFSAFRFTSISFLWYNVIGCVVVIATGLVVSVFERRRSLVAQT
ncbi:MAG TPA: sodium:solute symporter [Bryobacteraceae bacterium]|nr:sodium:solute symporter [Bryobacteraceae bacterium]